MRETMVRGQHHPLPQRATPGKITVERLSKYFGVSPHGAWALQHVSFSVQAGEFVALVGESGCGKTTLLRLIAGLEPPTAGRVTLAGHPIQAPSRDVGFVFQRPVLFPWRTVLENVLLPAELAHCVTPAARQYALHVLDVLGLQAFAGHRPAHLSGGMQQRVALARTLLLRPSVVLMDEPFGALDAITREQMHLELLHMWQQGAQTIVFITHDITEAVFLADRVLLMSRRPGTIAQSFPIPLPRPRTLEMRFMPQFTELCRTIHQTMGLTWQAVQEDLG